MKNHMTLKPWVITAENSAFHHKNKLHFKIYSNRKVILKCNSILQYYYLTEFFSKSFVEYETS